MEIIGKKKVKSNRILYKVKWKGYEDKEGSWEPLSNLQEFMDVIIDYDQQQPISKIMEHKLIKSKMHYLVQYVNFPNVQPS